MNVAQTAKGLDAIDGDGARVKRILPSYHLGYLDPFLLFDHFTVQKPAGFPSHPHRGFEIITYMLEGAFLHADNRGNQKMILAGGLQRITSGSGIVHSEMPGSNGVNRGLQLWINLPRSDKGMEPSYQDVAAADLPVVERQGVRRKILVGEGSPVRVSRPMRYEDVTLFAQSVEVGMQVPVPALFRAFLYVLDGVGKFGETMTRAEAGEIVSFDPPPSQGFIDVQAERADLPLRFIYVAGLPIGERPLFRGSYVD